MEFNIYQFHMEIKHILKLTSPNGIQRKGNNYSTQFTVRFYFLKCCMATIKQFEMLISKARTPKWVKKNKCKSSRKDWKPECSPWAQPLIGATCSNLKLLFSGSTFLLTLLWQLSKEGQVVLGHFLGLQIK